MIFSPLIAFAILFGFLLDVLFADPGWIPHPVVLIGKLISALEKGLRRAFPKTQKGERTAGTIEVILVVLVTFAVTGGLCYGALCLHPIVFLVLETFWCWQALAMRGLAKESRNVYNALRPECDIEKARKAVGRIVGRDTQNLTEEGVSKAAVETVAENFSDGVMSPLIYMMIGGAPLALVYKAINTMDSMLGYKNEKYINFGRTAAKLDDAANYIPSRIAALFFILGAGLMGYSMKEAHRIWKRDRRNHASPNSAQTESVCAGALGVQLAGPAYYFGEYYDKPTIGDPDRPVEPEDILKTNKMMYFASAAALTVCLLVRIAWTIGFYVLTRM